MPSLINAERLDTSPPEWTVDGIIPRVGYGIMRGPSYSGKSLVADNELTLAIANGTPFFGRQTVTGCTCIALGEGLYDAGVRLQARLARQTRDNEAVIERAGGSEEEQAALREAMPPYTDERVFVMTSPFAIPVTQQGEASDSMKHALAQLRVIPDLELIVIDAMSDFSGGLSISNDASANRYVLGLKMLVRELDCVVLVIAHNTADDKKMIGAQRFFNAADFIMQVIPDDNEPGALKTATITCEKSKYGPEFDALSYQIEPLEWEQELEPDEDENEDSHEEPEMVTVRSATVRYQADENAISANALRLPGDGTSPHRELPEVRDAPRPKKRSGVRNGRVRSGGDSGSGYDQLRAEGKTPREAMRLTLAGMDLPEPETTGTEN
jgi:AAA domain